MTQQTYSINQMIEVLRKENAIELAKLMPIPDAYAQVLAIKAAEQEITATEETNTTAHSNGKLYTEEEMQLELNKRLREMAAAQTPIQAQQQPAPAQTVSPEEPVSTFDYIRHVSAYSVRQGGEGLAIGFEFLGDLSRSGFYGLAGLTRSGSNWVADMLDPIYQQAVKEGKTIDQLHVAAKTVQA